LIVPIDRGRLIDLAYRRSRRPLLTYNFRKIQKAKKALKYNYNFRKVQKAKKALKYNPTQKNFLTNF